MAKINGNNILANCIGCDGALSNFETMGSFGSNVSPFRYGNIVYSSITYKLYKCTGCGKGGMSTVYQSGDSKNTVLFDFYPELGSYLTLPIKTPDDITSEFRSAEECAGINEYRPAGAMLRSTLEKVLSDHGYKERQLTTNINNAFDDGVLTMPLKKRAFEVVKALGDEILHQTWKEITPEQYEDSHEYTQRIIENFYDDPEAVNEVLVAKGRIKPETEEIASEEPKS